MAWYLIALRFGLATMDAILKPTRADETAIEAPTPACNFAVVPASLNCTVLRGNLEALLAVNDIERLLQLNKSGFLRAAAGS